MDDYRLSKEAISQLKQEHRKAKTKWEADRLKTVYLLGEGWKPEIVALILDRNKRTILSYYQNYKDGKIDRLLPWQIKCPSFPRRRESRRKGLTLFL